MRLLFLTPQPPYPPHAGGALRTLGLLDGLYKAGCQVDLLTFVEHNQQDPKQTPAATLCDEIVSVPTPQRAISQRVRDLVAGKADLERRFYSPQFADALRTQLARHAYDAIQFEGLEVTPYLPLVKAAAPTLKTIYSSTNAEYELQHGMYLNDRRDVRRVAGLLYSLIQWRRLIRYERWVCENVTQVIATSQTDADSFARLAPHAPISVVPNGIFVNEYTSENVQAQLELGSSALLFTGSMGYRPNVDAALWFSDQILSRVREAVPDARLFVVGNRPHARLDPLRQRPDVKITGYVQNILPFLYGCAVYVVPLRMGGGTRLKLLQAMAAQRAIVSTAIGAQGLDAMAGRDLLIANDAASFAQNVIALLRDPTRRATMGSAAYSFVCDHYDWSVIMPRLMRMYQEMGLA